MKMIELEALKKLIEQNSAAPTLFDDLQAIEA
jgi:hypothetical protein